MTPMPGGNPYRPGVGTQPRYFAGRERELRRFRSALGGAPEIPANVRLTGLRGVGKTVLLSRFSEVARDAGWEPAVLELEPRHEREPELLTVLTTALRSLEQRVSRGARTRQRLTGEWPEPAEAVLATPVEAVACDRHEMLAGAAKAVGQLALVIEGVSVRVDPSVSDAAPELSKALLGVVRTTVDSGRRGVVILLDEAQVLRDDRRASGSRSLSMLLAAVVALQRAEVPLALVLCGLPTLTNNLLAARTYSERMFRGEHIGRLDDDEARAAFTQPLDGTGVSVDERLIGAVLDAVEGYPYFIQLWGAELWDAADAADVQHLSTELLQVVESDVYRRLDLDFYEPRLSSLTPAEQDVMIASGTCPYPPLVVADLHRRSEKTAANVNVLLGRLVEAGVLYRVRKGQYEYTAPRFSEFLQRRSERRAW